MPTRSTLGRVLALALAARGPDRLRRRPSRRHPEHPRARPALHAAGLEHRLQPAHLRRADRLRRARQDAARPRTPGPRTATAPGASTCAMASPSTTARRSPPTTSCSVSSASRPCPTTRRRIPASCWVEDVRKVDDYTVDIVTEDYMPLLPPQIAKLRSSRSTPPKGRPPKTSTPAGPLSAPAPYRLVSVQGKDKVFLERFDAVLGQEAGLGARRVPRAAE